MVLGDLNIYMQKKEIWCSGQDGGVGRNPSLPCTTNRRITINKQKCQKIKLHGTLTTKELKK